MRVPDLHAFRRVIAALCTSEALVVVPTRSAGRLLVKTFDGLAGECLTRDETYDNLQARLPSPPPRLTSFARDAIAQAAAVEAAREIPDLSFRLRPGLIAELLRFYDQLRRQSQTVRRFEELMHDALAGATGSNDRGADRMLRQTQFLAGAFREYERQVGASGGCDEHLLRERLISEPAVRPLRHAIVTVADWIADPDGLFVADFDLLARIPGLERIDLVSTDATLGSGFHERLLGWLPGFEEVDGHAVIGSGPRLVPTLVTPKNAPADRPWWTFRDREEELAAIARESRPETLHDDGNDGRADTRGRHSTAVVFKRPLPYLYLAPETFGRAGIPYGATAALPLAAEPVAAAVDLILEAVETNFVRSALIALLRSPHFDLFDRSSRALSVLDAVLSNQRYLGELPSLQNLAANWPTGADAQEARPALDAALAAATELAPLLEPASASRQIRRLGSFLEQHLRPLPDDDRFASRERRGRSAIATMLTAIADAHQAHHDPSWMIEDLASAVRRWLGEETFAPESRAGGVQLLDDQTARYGTFDRLALVGLLENEWPEQPRRNIFYPAAMLKALGWPSEKDRRSGADARFLDLLKSATRRVTVSTVTLDGDALVMRSTQLDEISRAGLPAASLEGQTEVGSTETSRTGESDAREWSEMRANRPPADAPAFHGVIGTVPSREWSVSALETYLGCPFRFYAQHILRLDEEPDDEEVMDPRKQGQFVHTVFEQFFREWQASGHASITPDNLDAARDLFETIVDRLIATLPPGEDGLERTRLLGSSAAAGLGEAVFRMEAERPVAVVERLLEHKLSGQFAIATADGPREIALRGKADRIDLLADSTFRLIDYKLGWPPKGRRVFQLPIYGLRAQQQLASYRGRRWTLGEAAYLAFKGPKRVVPLFSNSDRDKVLVEAQQRLSDTLDAIERGEFPPTPDDVYRCETCSFSSVCRKDYVGDV